MSSSTDTTVVDQSNKDEVELKLREIDNYLLSLIKNGNYMNKHITIVKKINDTSTTLAALIGLLTTYEEETSW